jgi:Family of unknown function (DUF6502)
MSLRIAGSSMSKLEKINRSTESMLKEAAALCAVNRISEADAVQIFSTAFRNAQSEYAPVDSDEPQMFIAAQILSEWHQNPAFLNSDGLPKTLSLSANDFEQLCNATNKSCDPAHILELLHHAGAVKRTGDELIALRREIIIGDSHPAAAARAIRLAASFLSTLKHNLTRNVREAPRFERTVVMPFFSERHLPSLLAYLSVHAQSFLEDIDAWMEPRSSKSDGAQVGVGIYFFRQ